MSTACKRAHAKELLEVLRTAGFSDTDILDEVVATTDDTEILQTLEFIGLMWSVARRPNG